MLTHLLPHCLTETILSFFLFQVGYIRIDGSVPSSERIQLVRKFQNDPETRVAVLSIQAAGQVVTKTPPQKNQKQLLKQEPLKDIHVFQLALDFQVVLRRFSATM